MQNNILEKKTELASWATFTGVNIQGSIPISGKDFSIQNLKRGNRQRTILQLERKIQAKQKQNCKTTFYKYQLNAKRNIDLKDYLVVFENTKLG